MLALWLLGRGLAGCLVVRIRYGEPPAGFSRSLTLRTLTRTVLPAHVLGPLGGLRPQRAPSAVAPLGT